MLEYKGSAVTLSDGEDKWEVQVFALAALPLPKEGGARKLPLYILFKNGEMVSCEPVIGCMLQRFSNIIPNEICAKLEEFDKKLRQGVEE